MGERPWPAGDLSRASLEEILEASSKIWSDHGHRRGARRRGFGRLLGHLGGLEGETWQQRWDASEFTDGTRRVRELTGRAKSGGETTQALMLLICLRVIRPSVAVFRRNRLVGFYEHFAAAQDDPGLRQFAELVEAKATSPHLRRRACFDVAGAMVTQGVALGDLSAAGLLHYAVETRRGRFGQGYELYVGHLAWQVLAEDGHFGPSAPATLRAALRTPAMSPAELVAHHGVTHPEVSALLTDYLTRRSHDLDYTSLRDLAGDLCSNFWGTLVRLNPGQTDLALSEEAYLAWREAIGVRRDGRPRLGAEAVVTNVRALYLDIASWATLEPRWARWAAPCPVGARDVRAGSKARRRSKERMDDRTRRLQPLLPVFVAAIDARREHLAALLKAASEAGGGQRVVVDGRAYTRLFSAGDLRAQEIHGRANVRVRDERTGRTLNVTFTEDTAFWLWACVETLRHTGARCEEILELSQLSIRQYQRPGGEVVAVLVIAPSKTDRERVIPMTAELFHVVAVIIRRLTRARPTVALATRYDKAEHVTSEPQPFLFQRTLGRHTEVIAASALRQMLSKACSAVAGEHPELAEISFTPHDFRRLFATDLVNNGLPIHIGAALLGHLNLQTTLGYVTVFPEDVIRHYQAHLATRRALRPVGEYRQATDPEWAEFEEHFDKRQVELGGCARPYSTPCAHEHACIRCPMLRVDPVMLDRLDEIHDDLLARRDRAREQGWLGELEGLELTIGFLVDKRADTVRIARRLTADLGLPRPPTPGMEERSPTSAPRDGRVGAERPPWRVPPATLDASQEVR